MMTNRDYKKMVEKKYGKQLKDIMHELVVDKGLDQWDGSAVLGVPKNIFVKWRTQFRLGPIQRMADYAEKRRQDIINEYKKQLVSVDLYRDFIFKEEKSLTGFKELIERMLELAKYRRTLVDTDSTIDLSIVLQIGMLEEILNYLEDYQKDRLHKKYENYLADLKMIMKNKD